MCVFAGKVFESVVPTRDLSLLPELSSKNTAAVDEELFVRPKWRYKWVPVCMLVLPTFAAFTRTSHARTYTHKELADIHMHATPTPTAPLSYK